VAQDMKQSKHFVVNFHLIMTNNNLYLFLPKEP
jgi:hypothetical protein